MRKTYPLVDFLDERSPAYSEFTYYWLNVFIQLVVQTVIFPTHKIAHHPFHHLPMQPCGVFDELDQTANSESNVRASANHQIRQTANCFTVRYVYFGFISAAEVSASFHRCVRTLAASIPKPLKNASVYHFWDNHSEPVLASRLTSNHKQCLPSFKSSMRKVLPSAALISGNLVESLHAVNKSSTYSAMITMNLLDELENKHSWA